MALQSSWLQELNVNYSNSEINTSFYLIVQMSTLRPKEEGLLVKDKLHMIIEPRIPYSLSSHG